MSDAINTGSKHISYVSGSYKAIGNDGNHFNKSINSGSNNSVPANVLTALYNNSDHLPVVLELDLDNTIAGVSEIEKANRIQVRYENPINNNLELLINSQESQMVEVRIYDIQGRQIASRAELISANSRIQFDMSSMAKGLYIIQIMGTQNQVIYSGKVIKQ
jgi:hypothetical protein